MKYSILIIAFIASTFSACHFSHSHNVQQNSHHEHDEIKFQYTSYTNNFELFAEADAFIVGNGANVLSHFSTLPNFKALESGSITIVLLVNGKEVRQKLNNPTRKGIYSFDITPEIAGKGTLRFEIVTGEGSYVVEVPEIMVFNNIKEAEEVASQIVIPETNATYFTKEQSWKIDFATDFPQTEPFGQIIKTTAVIKSSQNSEIVVTAKASGTVRFNSESVFEGHEVLAGQTLFTISANNIVDNNSSVKYAEAKNNFEKAKADYQRALELVKDKIVSEKEFLTYQNQYLNAKANYDNISKDFTPSGHIVASPQQGFIKQIFAKNGAFVESGQPLVIVSQNKNLLLSSDIPVKYASVLPNIKTAHIHNNIDNKTYTLEELNGKLVAVGKATNNDNFLIPVNIQIENNGSFVEGSYVDLILKTFSSNTSLTVPTAALIEEQGIFFVWVQVHPELFEKRMVYVGGNDGIKTEIKKGIDPGERIVTQGAVLIKLAQATGGLDAHSGHNH